MDKKTRPDCGVEYADVSWVKHKWLDIPYDNRSESQKLDIYLPDKGQGPFPVVMSIHGGAFALGDKQSVEIIPHWKGLDRGYAVVGVNYRLSGEALFPAALIDVKAALLYIRKHAGKYALDANRIIAWGCSAGGYLAAMLALTDHVDDFRPDLDDDRYSLSLQGAIDWYGPTDFLLMDQHFETTGFGIRDHNEPDSPESRFLGGQITKIPDKVKEASPITYVSHQMPPMYIQHGLIDELVPVQQSMMLGNKINQVAGHERVRFEILDNACHGGDAFENDENIEKMFDFIKHILN